MWRNWQTHCTQNAADNLRAGSNPAIGIVWKGGIESRHFAKCFDSIPPFLYVTYSQELKYKRVKSPFLYHNFTKYGILIINTYPERR